MARMAGELFKNRWILLCTLAGLTTTLVGCRPAALLYYLLLAPEPKIPAEFDSLKGSKTVLLVHASTNAQLAHPTIETELQRLIAKRLLENVEKIQIADPTEVANWCAEHEGYSLEQLGKAFDADYVVQVELHRFAIEDPSSPELYQGHATATIQVADVEKGGEIVYDAYVESTFPASRAVPSSEISALRFRDLYVKRVADEIARHFHAYRREDTFSLH